MVSGIKEAKVETLCSLFKDGEHFFLLVVLKNQEHANLLARALLQPATFLEQHSLKSF